MKKLLLLLLIVFLGYCGYVIYDNYFRVPKLEIEDKAIDIDELYIYGTHLNMHGDEIDDENVDFVLYDGKFLSYDIINDNDGFSFSDKINDGLYLDDIPIGTYYAFLRSTSKDDDDNEVYKYYSINNTTDYEDTTYYTFSNVGNKIVISNDDKDYNTLMFTVTRNHDKNIYDVVIDPGHGGKDTGAEKNGSKETDFTMDLALDLKSRLEEYGVKVKLTREEGQLSDKELLDDYGKGGRAVISHEVNAKYVFSIHLNSGSQSIYGTEIYTANNINYDFAKKLVDNIVTKANTTYSNNKINKVYDGIYTRMFTEEDIEDSLLEYEKKQMNPYEITTKSIYYFMIRETGGIMTGAYIDKRNKDINPGNPYFDSNVGSEAYIFELGYLSNVNNLNNIKNNEYKYTEAIAEVFKDVFVREE